MTRRAALLPVAVALVALAGCGTGGRQSLGAAPGSGSTPVPPAAGASPTPAGAPATAPPPGSGSATAGTATAGPPSSVSGTTAGGTASPVPPGRRPPSPTPVPQPTSRGGVVTVTEQNSGQTVHLLRGEQLRVELGQNGSTWDPPTSSDGRVLPRQSSTGGYPTGRPVDARFLAAAAGSARVSATSDAACFHTTPRCEMASRIWQVSVIVA